MSSISNAPPPLGVPPPGSGAWPVSPSLRSLINSSSLALQGHVCSTAHHTLFAPGDSHSLVLQRLDGRRPQRVVLGTDDDDVDLTIHDGEDLAGVVADGHAIERHGDERRDDDREAGSGRHAAADVNSPLDGVTLAVEEGEIHALVGENGAGKSTLMKVLSGVYPHGSYDGKILYDGAEAQFGSIADSERQGIIIIHQELALVPLLSIAENLFLGNEVATRGVISWPDTFARTEKLLRKVGLRETPTTKVDKLGVGKQQLVEIAKALSKEVRLLILDEPTAALQENDSQVLLDLLLELIDQSGRGADVPAPGLGNVEALKQPSALNPEQVGDRAGPAEVDQGRVD
ncbi:hypothetical protein LCGC14_2937610, partial [marine sediment metagenome]